MTNKPFSKRMLESKKKVGYRTHSYKWKYHPTPWKLFIDAIAKPRDTTFSAFGNRGFVLGLVCLSMLIIGLAAYSDPNSELFHNYIVGPTLPVHSTDPTTKLTSYTGSSSDLSGWQTLGNVSYVAGSGSGAGDSFICNQMGVGTNKCFEFTQNTYAKILTTDNLANNDTLGFSTCSTNQDDNGPPPGSTACYWTMESINWTSSQPLKIESFLMKRTSGINLATSGSMEAYVLAYNSGIVGKTSIAQAFPVTKAIAKSIDVNATSIPIDVFTWINFTFTPAVSLTVGTTYFIGLWSVNLNGAISVGDNFCSSAHCISVLKNDQFYGNLATAFDPVQIPSNWSPDAFRDMLFRIYDGYDVNYSMALSKTPVGDLSIAVGKELQFFYLQRWNRTGFTGLNTPPKQVSFDMFLTRNSTLPTIAQSNYNPLTDTNVALVIRSFPLTSDFKSWTVELLFQRNQQDTIAQENTGGCEATTSCFVNVTTVDNTSRIGTNPYMILNYTGGSLATAGNSTCPVNGQNGGPQCSYLINTNAINNNIKYTKIFPYFPISGTTYYMGFYREPDVNAKIMLCFQTSTNGAGNCVTTATPLVNGCISANMELDYCVPEFVTPPAPPSPITDSGGFFGSLGRTLGGVGHFIAGGATALYNTVVAPVANAIGGLEGPLIAAINTAFQILTFALVTAMNAIGGFFGLGNIGTTIASFFISIGNFLTNGFNAIVGQIGNGITFFVNGVTAFGNLAATYFNYITSFLTALSNFVSILGTVVTSLLALGGFSGNIALFMDWTWGMYKVYDEGTEGFHRWLDFNENIFLKIGKGTYFLADHLFTVILRVKQMLTGWL